MNIEQRIKTLIGELQVTVMVLQEQLEAKNKEIEELKNSTEKVKKVNNG